MSKHIKLKKGFNINLAGKAEKKIGSAPKPSVFAIKPTDFVGVDKIKILVKEGDEVKAGTPLFASKQDLRIKFTAPVSGIVRAIKRGEKRKLLEIQIQADAEVSYEQFTKYSVSEINSISRETAAHQMLEAGVWANIIQRPYGVVALPNVDDPNALPDAHGHMPPSAEKLTPKAIFISGFDTHPLAPDYDFTLKGEENYFQAGISILSKFTKGKIHLNLPANEIPSVFSKVSGVQVNKFEGKHPVGNVGVQIHHIDPINKGDIVWTVNPYGVVQIGKLFLEGKYDASKVIAVAGSELKTPQYYKTYTGAPVSVFIENNLKQDNVRIISGNVLTGTKVEKDGFIGFYDQLLTVIPEGNYHEFLGWIAPSTRKLSAQKAIGLLSFLNGSSKEYVIDSNTHGEKRAFVQTGIFEDVTPMDIYPMYLIKAILANDYDSMEALGIYEVIEEDLALCEFVDVSKHEIQSILREGIEMIRHG